MASLGDLLARYRALSRAGIEPAACLNHWGTTSLYYRDPDALQVELFIDNVTPERSIEYMQSDAFRANSVGVPFDPDDLARRYESGEPISQLVQQAGLDDAKLEQMIAVGQGMGEAARLIKTARERR
jgi:hypothetical protein